MIDLEIDQYFTQYLHNQVDGEIKKLIFARDYIIICTTITSYTLYYKDIDY